MSTSHRSLALAVALPFLISPAFADSPTWSHEVEEARSMLANPQASEPLLRRALGHAEGALRLVQAGNLPLSLEREIMEVRLACLLRLDEAPPVPTGPQVVPQATPPETLTALTEALQEDPLSASRLRTLAAAGARTVPRMDLANPQHRKRLRAYFHHLLTAQKPQHGAMSLEVADTLAGLAGTYLRDEDIAPALQAIETRHLILARHPQGSYAMLRDSRRDFLKALQAYAPRFWVQRYLDNQISHGRTAGPSSLSHALALTTAAQVATTTSTPTRENLQARMRSLGPPTLGRPEGALAEVLERLAIRASWTGLDRAGEAAQHLKASAENLDAREAVDQLEAIEAELRRVAADEEANALHHATSRLRDRLAHLGEVVALRPPVEKA